MTSWHHFYSAVTQKYQNLSRLHLFNFVSVHVYSYIPHWKVLKHLIYGRYECEMQSVVVYSLNHDIMASFPLNCHTKLPTSDLELSMKQCKGDLICLCTWLKGAETLHTCPIWMWELFKGVYSQNHDIMASFPLNGHPEMLKTNQAHAV